MSLYKKDKKSDIEEIIFLDNNSPEKKSIFKENTLVMGGRGNDVPQEYIEAILNKDLDWKSFLKDKKEFFKDHWIKINNPIIDINLEKLISIGIKIEGNCNNVNLKNVTTLDQIIISRGHVYGDIKFDSCSFDKGCILKGEIGEPLVIEGNLTFKKSTSSYVELVNVKVLEDLKFLGNTIKSRNDKEIKTDFIIDELSIKSIDPNELYNVIKDTSEIFIQTGKFENIQFVGNIIQIYHLENTSCRGQLNFADLGEDPYISLVQCDLGPTIIFGRDIDEHFNLDLIDTHMVYLHTNKGKIHGFRSSVRTTSPGNGYKGPEENAPPIIRKKKRFW